MIEQLSGESDVFTPEFFRDPYLTYRRFRDIDPVLELPFNLNLEQSQSITGDDDRTWVVTGHAAVAAALLDHASLSSALPSRDGAQLTEAEQGRLVLINSDPPRHTNLRNIVNRAFTPRQVASMEPDLRVLADGLVAALPRGSTVDLMHAIFETYPITVIATLLGIPAEHRTDFKRWSDAMVAAADPSTLADNLGEITAMNEYFVTEVAARRANPGDDLISLLVASDLADWEAVSFCVLLLLAGNETTRSLLGCLFTVLATRPDLWQCLKADRTLIDSAVEEALRFDSPVQVLNRWARRDMDLLGHEIPKYGNVAVAYAAANRDPAVFDRPDEFLLDRSGRHVAFGLGVHYCLGAPLARAEAKFVLGAMLDQFDSIESTGSGAQFQASSRVVRGPSSLPVLLS